MCRDLYKVVLILISVLGSWAPPASAAAIETLLMPGKLSASHSKLENDCTNCHDRSNRTSQSTLCLSCHKDVNDDIQKKSGFHGRIENASRVECQACHTEHKGQNADIVKFVVPQFDHDKTDFKLLDAHASLSCSSCHQSGKKYREAASACVDCHKKVEPHQGQLGNDCASCHSTKTWLNAKFDHGKTNFPLINKHAAVTCSACHIGNKYKNTPMSCVSCHAPDDVHQRSRGSECEKCHTTISWTTAKFDHAKETGFALLGAHAGADCANCHTTGRLQDDLPKDCNGCHKAQDSHAGRLGQQCETCHGVSTWKPAKFDHERDAKYRLPLSHDQLSCHTCHTANISQQKLGTACIACHRAQDAHATQLGTQCDQCHVANSWRKDVYFDHDLTDFPLVGLHVAVTCAQCHLTKRFKDASTDCYSCHQKNDVHKGGLGKSCADCHNTNGWNLWSFDHGKVTHFELTGAHSKLNCSNCHTQPASEVKLSTECGSCHVRDDIHFGQFGRQCQRCHTTISFKKVRLQ